MKSKKAVWAALPLTLMLSSSLQAGGLLNIHGVDIEFDASPVGSCAMGDMLLIHGEGFGYQTSALSATLADVKTQVCSVVPDQIIVRCPEGFCDQGDRRLKVTRKLSYFSYLWDTYDLTIGGETAEAKPALTGLERITTTVSGIGIGQKKVDTADCPEGKVPIGGGYDINPNTVDGQVIVMESGPYGGGTFGVGWRVRADGSATTAVWELVINVYCVTEPL